MKSIVVVLASACLLIQTGCGSQVPQTSLANPMMGMSQVQSFSQKIPTAPASQSRFYDTAKDSFRWVESEGRQWDLSAELASVEAIQVDEKGKAWDWVYVFVSPFKRNALEVKSNHQSREIPKPTFSSSFDDFEWQIDSLDAVEQAKKQGLKVFPIHRMTLNKRFGLQWELQTSSGYYRIPASRTAR